MQTDGNLVITCSGEHNNFPIWDTGTTSVGGDYVQLDWLGKLRVRAGKEDKDVWVSGLNYNNEATTRLHLTPVGNLLIENFWGHKLWETTTRCWHKRTSSGGGHQVPEDDLSK
jgi:hypothetical protein